MEARANRPPFAQLFQGASRAILSPSSPAAFSHALPFSPRSSKFSPRPPQLPRLPLRLFDGEFLSCAREETASKHNPPACCLWVRFDATSMGHGLHEDIARGSDLGATQAVRIRRG